MREWAGIALTHHPDDEYAKEKQALAQQLLAEQRANNKQFSTILQRIKTLILKGDGMMLFLKAIWHWKCVLILRKFS